MSRGRAAEKYGWSQADDYRWAGKYKRSVGEYSPSVNKYKRSAGEYGPSPYKYKRSAGETIPRTVSKPYGPVGVEYGPKFVDDEPRHVAYLLLPHFYLTQKCSFTYTEAAF